MCNPFLHLKVRVWWNIDPYLEVMGWAGGSGVSLAAPNPMTLKKGLGKLNTKKSLNWNAISEISIL